jgi:predicted MFS family arabinose efflux permease
VATGIVTYVIAWTVLGVGGALGLSAPAFTAVVEREGAEGKRTIAILMLFTGLSATIFWPLLSLMNETIGWRPTFVLCAGLQIFVCLPLYLFGLPKPVASQSRSEAADIAPVALSPGERRLAFLLVAITTTIASFVTFGLAPALLDLLQRAGASPQLALQLAAARGVIGISARGIDMMLGRRGNPFLTSVAGCSMVLLGLVFLLLLPPSASALWIFILFYGFGSGVLVVARALLPLALFSPREFGLQSARLSMPQNLANAIAPIVFTAILDRIGHQTLLVFSGALICLALVAIALLIRLVRTARGRTDATPLPP